VINLYEKRIAVLEAQVGVLMAVLKVRVRDPQPVTIELKLEEEKSVEGEEPASEPEKKD